jgi:hypothetical protein
MAEHEQPYKEGLSARRIVEVLGLRLPSINSLGWASLNNGLAV